MQPIWKGWGALGWSGFWVPFAMTKRTMPIDSFSHIFSNHHVSIYFPVFYPDRESWMVMIFPTKKRNSIGIPCSDLLVCILVIFCLLTPGFWHEYKPISITVVIINVSFFMVYKIFHVNKRIDALFKTQIFYFFLWIDLIPDIFNLKFNKK